MENSKLIAVLSKLNKSELLQLKDFVHSPFFNKNEEVLLLFNYLHKNAPHFPHHKIQKEKVYENLFPGKAYDAKHMNYIMNFLFKLVERFISVHRILAHPFLADNELLNGYIDLKLDKHFQFQYRRTEKSLEKRKVHDAVFYEQKYQLAKISELHFSKLQSSRKKNHYLQTVSDTLDVHYLINKLRYTVAMLDHSKNFNFQYDIKLIHSLEKELLRSDYVSKPAIRFYYEWYLMIKNEENTERYKKFLNLFHEQSELLSFSELKEVYFSLINYCIRKVARHEANFNRELLELYITGIENSILLENGLLSPWTYKNITRLSFGLKEYDWIEKFIHHEKDKLPRNARADAYHYNMAYLHFEKNEYDQAVRHLTQVEFSDVYYLLDSKILRMKIYYEEEEIEALLSLIKSFQVLLRRNKLVANEIKEAYLNFSRVLLQLLKFDQPATNKSIQMINEMKLLTERQWLITKATTKKQPS